MLQFTRLRTYTKFGSHPGKTLLPRYRKVLSINAGETISVGSSKHLFRARDIISDDRNARNNFFRAEIKRRESSFLDRLRNWESRVRSRSTRDYRPRLYRSLPTIDPILTAVSLLNTPETEKVEAALWGRISVGPRSLPREAEATQVLNSIPSGSTSFTDLVRQPTLGIPERYRIANCHVLSGL